MKLPSVPRKGFSVAKLCSEIIAFMRSSRIVSVTGGRLKQTPNGQIIDIPKPPPPPATIAPPLWVSVFYDGSAWKYHVNEGHVITQNIKASGGLTYYTPTLGGTALDADTPPTGTLPANTCFIYVNVTTTSKGVVNGVPTITSSGSEQTSTHHIPPDDGDASGTAGNYYFLIAEFEESTESELAAPKTIRRLPGNKWVPNQLVELDNIGTGAKVAKDYDPATDQHKLRTLVERQSGSVQISVTERTDDILIDGNGYDNTGSGFATGQSVSDGLVTIFTDLAFGADGSFTTNNPCDTGYYTITVAKGLITDITFTSY